MLQLQEISKSYGKQLAVQNVSLDLLEGEAILIKGPTGCGKTTLLKLIAGLELPDKGEIINRGILISKPGWASEPSSRSIGFVFQEPALWPHMTVRQQILFGLFHHSKQEADEVLGQVAHKLTIEAILDRYPHEISGGESRLVALARSVAPEPGLLLMDEPLVNLNPELKKRVWKFLDRYFQSDDKSVIYVTHDPGEIGFFPGRVLSMKEGKLFNEEAN